MAQRLVRRICRECKETYSPSDAELTTIGLTREQLGTRLFARGAGCPTCQQTGFQGREGIYEIMLIDDEIRGLILKNVDSSTIKRTAIGKGMVTLRDDGIRKVLENITTYAEVLRVTQADTL
jgi:general secretion pathway protein E